MRAVEVAEYGGPEVLVLRERDEPVAGAGEVVVTVAAAGINFMDTYLRRGHLMQLPTPFVPGVDGAGTVLTVGPGVSDVAVGDRVAWQRVMGSYAEQVVVPVKEIVSVPDDVELEDAAAVLMQGLTAHHLSHAVLDAGSGVSALVHSAASGVGRMLTQIISARGGRVIASVSRPDKVDAARAAGADAVVIRADGPFDARVRELTGGRGVDVCYDGVGADAYEASVASIARGGTFVHFGQASGPIPPLDLWSQPDGVRLLRAQGFHASETQAARAVRERELFGWVSSGALSVLIGGRYPLEGAALAHAEIESQASTGKLLLVPR